MFHAHVRNEALHRLIVEDYGFYHESTFIKLDSNINVYESLFLSQILDAHIRSKATSASEPAVDTTAEASPDASEPSAELEPSSRTYSVLEIGCAYGTSSMMIANVLNRYPEQTRRFDIIDPYQREQWHSYGLENIERIKDSSYGYTLHEQTSDIALSQFDDGTLFDFIFIDGGHDFDTVVGDITSSLRLLAEGGLIVCDDVQHKSVKQAVNHVQKRLQKVRVRDGSIVSDHDSLYHTRREKKNIDDPLTMFAFSAATAPTSSEAAFSDVAPPAEAGPATFAVKSFEEIMREKKAKQQTS